MGVTTGTGTPSYLRGTAATRAKENDERFIYQVCWILCWIPFGLAIAKGHPWPCAMLARQILRSGLHHAVHVFRCREEIAKKYQTRWARYAERPTSGTCVQDQRTGKAAKAVQAIKDLKAKLAGHTRQEYAEAQVASKALQATRLEAAKAASTERTAKRASILHSLQTSPGAAAKLTVLDLRCLGAGLAKLDVLVLERMSPTVLASMTLDQVR